MTFERIRKQWKRLAPLLVAGAVVGGVGRVAFDRYFAGDCCAPGSPCCHPGSPCCHGHGATGGVASR